MILQLADPVVSVAVECVNAETETMGPGLGGDGRITKRRTKRARDVVPDSLIIP